MLLEAKPVLCHTIEVFAKSVHQPEIIVVLQPGEHEYWQKLCEEFNFTTPHRLADGGKTRFHSVKNGLKHVEGPALVAVHDAVRPLVSETLINTAYREAGKHGNAIAGLPSTDSVRMLNGANSVALKRETIFLIQTPQVFESETLINAYRQEYVPEFTDDASVIEASGETIHIIPGEQFNIKITYPVDLDFAGMILKQKK